MRVIRFLSLIVVILIGCQFSAAQPNPAEFIKSNYTKREVYIPMRDGVRLFTAIYEPKNKPEKLPILLNRTPYSISPYGDDKFKFSLGPSDPFAPEGFIFVYQDVRGKWMSEGEFVDIRPDIENTNQQQIDESTDTFDTVEWLIKNVADNNGRIGIYGVSYPGFYTSAGIIDTHPAIKAASPQAPVSDWFHGDDFHHNGAFFLPHAFNFYSQFGQARPFPATSQNAQIKPFKYEAPDSYSFFLNNLGTLANSDDLLRKQVGDIPFWNEMMKHPNYDQFWQERNILPKLQNINCAVLTVGGLFDAEDLYGTFKTYEHIERQNPGIFNVLVMGPWTHGSWSGSPGRSFAQIDFGSNTAEFYRTKIELPFFNYFLKDKGNISHIKEINIFETGANIWKTYKSWKPQNAEEKSLYLNGNKLATLGEIPKTSNQNSVSYNSNPSNPVPYTKAKTLGMSRDFMIEDQSFAAERSDVLVFQTEKLNKPVTVSGEIKPELFVAVKHNSQQFLDADFIIKIIDFFPESISETNSVYLGKKQMDGYQMLIRGEPMRARFRNSFEKPEAMQSGKIYKISFTMPAVNHTFLKGHRIMVQIQSTWFPLVDRNPQKYVANIFEAANSDFIPTTNSIYLSGMIHSNIKLPVLKNNNQFFDSFEKVLSGKYNFIPINEPVR